jgi:hypothetical protein
VIQPLPLRRLVRLVVLLVAALVVAASGSATAADTHPFGVDDLSALR